MTSKTYLRSLDYVRKILLLDFLPIGAGWFFGAETNLGMFFLWTSGIILLVLCGSLVVLSIVSKPLTIVSVTPLPRIDPDGNQTNVDTPQTK